MYEPITTLHGIATNIPEQFGDCFRGINTLNQSDNKLDNMISDRHRREYLWERAVFPIRNFC